MKRNVRSNRYGDISSYAIVENIVKEAHTKTKKTGAITRAVVGGAIAGGVGVVAGAITAGSKSSTIVHEIPDGFYLQIFDVLVTELIHCIR